MAAGGSRTLELKLVGNARNLNDTLRGTEAKVKTFGDKMDAFGRKAAAAFAVAKGAAVAFAGKLAVDAIKAASDLNEEVSKSEVIFGDAAGAVRDFAEGAARSLGQSRTQALEAASQFGIFGKSAGLQGPALSEFSTRLVGLASDLASFNNASPEETIFAIGAALRGESEPIRKYGVLLNDATLKARAMEMGLYDGSGALEQQARILAAFEEVLAQTGDAQGDFARTSDGLANQSRILNATFEDLKAQLGEALLPVANDLLAWALELAPKLEEMIPKVKDFIGAFLERVGEIKEDLQPALDGVIEWGREFLEDFRPGFMRGLDELKGGFGSFVEDVKLGYEDLEFGLHQLADAFDLEFDGMGAAVGRFYELVLKRIGDVLRGVGDAARGFGEFFAPFAEDVAARFRGAAASIDSRAGSVGVTPGTGAAVPSTAGGFPVPGAFRYEARPNAATTLFGEFLRTFDGSVPMLYGGYRGGGTYTPDRNMNVRIEGLVVDPEGTARAIDRLLEERARRMGPRVTAGSFG